MTKEKKNKFDIGIVSSPNKRASERSPEVESAALGLAERFSVLREPEEDSTALRRVFRSWQMSSRFAIDWISLKGVVCFWLRIER